MLPTQYQDVIFTRTYARWDYTKKRRETFEEAVARYFNFMVKTMEKKFENANPKHLQWLVRKLREAECLMLDIQSVGSMRALWAAGEALERENACAFNCGYTKIEVEDLKDFAEILYLLLCGTGLSYSAERQFINNLPRVTPRKGSAHLPKTVVFEDSKEGWGEGFLEYMQLLFAGETVVADVSKLRPAGSILRTFGGRSSGPAPLLEMLGHVKRIVLGAQGRKLHSEEVADIVCFIAQAVVVGGARRSATMALTNPSDRRMAEYKKGDFRLANSQRDAVNVSAVYTEKPDVLLFMEDWMHLVESKTGERGIINRESFHATMREQGREPDGSEGTNPLIHLAA